MVHTGASILALALLASAAPAAPQQNASAAKADPGAKMFEAQCGFCHGREATGGAGGPDLTDSALVAEDVRGNKIGPVIRAGRPDKGMPGFTFSDKDLRAIVDYIHARKKDVDENPGRRRKVSAADLATGSADAGRAYFEGTGGCTACHSPTGDLAGVSTRYRGLALMQRMLYPTSGNAAPLAEGEKAKPNPATVTITLPGGETVTGSLASRDEFTIAIKDAAGWHRSWPVSQVKFTIKDPLEAHAALLTKYSDADIHNLVAYLQTIR